MFGSPLLSTLLLAVLFSAVGIPLFQLTRPVTPVTREAPTVYGPAQSTGTPAFLTIRAAHPFRSLRLFTSGTLLAEVENEASEYEIDLMVGDTFELEFDFTWPPETPETAVFLSIEPDGKELQSITYWGQTRLNRIHTFQWETQNDE